LATTAGRALAGYVVALALSCGVPPEVVPPPPPEPLVVASDLENMPFAGVDEAGRPIGRDIEMMEAVAAHLGRPLHWKRMAFEVLLPAVEDGTVDIVCATVGITAERDARIDFSDPYFSTFIEVVVRKGPGEPRRWADLDGRRVAGGRGTTSERAVRRVLPGAIGVFENKEQLGSRERLVSGEIDGLAMDGPNAAALVAQHEGELTLLLTPLAPERYALVLAEGRTELRRLLDEALTALRRDGTMDRLDTAWKLSPTD